MSRATLSAPFTIACSICHMLVVDAGPDAPVSHGICKACYPIYRAELGLAPKPYPTKAMEAA